MTKKERDQVVELLRCAADFSRTGGGWPPPLCEADAALGGAGLINSPSRIQRLAADASADVIGGFALGCAGDSHAVADACLEATLRVKQNK